jgi:photosystem II stability/assembly factor-like uncharacterized protein
VGYGVILRTIDRANTWVPDRARGDFFKSICFSDSSTAYVVGDYGSIYKSTDAALTWKKIKYSNTIFNTNNRLTDVFFLNTDFGVISGRNGLLWITENAASTWKPVKNLPNIDFNKVFISNHNILLASQSGKLFIVNIP